MIMTNDISIFPLDTYYSVLKSIKKDWEVLMHTGPWGASATVHDRLCVRNGNNMVCVNMNGTLTYLNPSTQDAFPLDIFRRGGEVQFLLPSGTAIETNYGQYFNTRISVQPADFGGLVGIGNNTDLHSVTAQASRKAWIETHVFPNSTGISILDSKNLTNGLQFSSATGSPLGYSACIPGVSRRAEDFYKKLVIFVNTTRTEVSTVEVKTTATVVSYQRIDSINFNTKWTTATENAVVAQRTTSTNLLTAHTTVTDVSTSKVTSTALATSTVVVGTKTVVSSQAFATSVNVIDATKIHTSDVTVTRNHEATVTDVKKVTKVTQKNVETTEGTLSKLNHPVSN